MGCPVVVDFVEFDEQTTGEHGFLYLKLASVLQFLRAPPGSVAVKALTLEVFECTVVLTGLAWNDIPTRPTRENGFHVDALTNSDALSRR
jgi:hypothetical protein